MSSRRAVPPVETMTWSPARCLPSSLVTCEKNKIEYNVCIYICSSLYLAGLECELACGDEDEGLDGGQGGIELVEHGH